MELLKVNSYLELQEKLKGTERAFLLLYKEGSPQSECALKNLESVEIPADKVVMMKANVGEVATFTRFTTFLPSQPFLNLMGVSSRML